MRQVKNILFLNPVSPDKMLIGDLMLIGELMILPELAEYVTCLNWDNTGTSHSVQGVY